MKLTLENEISSDMNKTFRFSPAFHSNNKHHRRQRVSFYFTERPDRDGTLLVFEMNDHGN